MEEGGPPFFDLLLERTSGLSVRREPLVLAFALRLGVSFPLNFQLSINSLVKLGKLTLQSSCVRRF